LTYGDTGMTKIMRKRFTTQSDQSIRSCLAEIAKTSAL
jgi:hypothetical protein